MSLKKSSKKYFKSTYLVPTPAEAVRVLGMILSNRDYIHHGIGVYDFVAEKKPQH